MVALVERDGSVRSFHVPTVSRDNLRPILNEQIDKATYLMTDEAKVYPSIGREYAGHGTVNHSIKEYVRGVFLTCPPKPGPGGMLVLGRWRVGRWRGGQDATEATYRGTDHQQAA